MLPWPKNRSSVRLIFTLPRPHERRTSSVWLNVGIARRDPQSAECPQGCLAAIQNLVAALESHGWRHAEKINAIVAAPAVAAVTQNTQDDQLVAVLRAKLADPEFRLVAPAIISGRNGLVGQQNPVEPVATAGTPDRVPCAT